MRQAPAAIAAAAGRVASSEELLVALQRVRDLVHRPLAGSEHGSFAEATLTKRLPSILANAVEELRRQAASGTQQQQQQHDQEEQQAGQQASVSLTHAASEVAQLREDMLANAEVVPLRLPPGCPPDLSWSIEATNACLAWWQQRSPHPTWLGLPWLLVECYAYVAVRTILQAHAQKHEKGGGGGDLVDPFRDSKLGALLSSATSARDMAARMRQLLRDGAEDAAGAPPSDLRQDCFEVLQYALWGNKTDLSLLVDVAALEQSRSGDDAAARVKAAGGDAESHPFLIVDDFLPLWELLQPAAGGAAPAQQQQQQQQRQQRRIDIVLDNAALELFSDLCLADFLVSRGLADRIVLHGKAMPWFVSDATEADLQDVLRLGGQQPAAAQQGQAEAEAGAKAEAGADVRWLCERWRGHLSRGTWAWRCHPFWTCPAPMYWMEALSPDLHADLRDSALLIFKGDLNYRRLTQDGRWPWTTPFPQALLGFGPAPLVTLRTLKADVQVGLAPGQGEALGEVDPQWQVNGKFGVLQCSP